ncbi:TolC family protein [Aliarcobacter butzleri]|uniref:TolC family protein n=1 Tax=Aliarcobacter butzleri TaxID=28197 RepID=A0AAW7Q9J8_9BACT|nr:TolC family protein [Aliarcobacter butzleri]MCT7568625.1 TolC family protein [Aliarcobacter butzleri]MDN5107487.1 TolC family protein [Aliarcobacter butzleri]MDN5122705.1 TolC family protein [Aliarcobacter butzleri]
MAKNKIFSAFLIFFSVYQSLNAEDFKYLLNKALESNSNLKSSEIEVQLAKENGSILTRYDNPIIEFSYADYKSKEKGNKEKGQGVSITQKIVPWNVANDKTDLSDAIIKNEVDKYNLDKQEFIKELSLRYTIYAKNKSFLEVIKESQKIATKIYDISNEKYKLGAISKADLLQSEIELIDIKKKENEINLEIMSSYYDLMKFAGIEEQYFNLDSDYKFNITNNANLERNPFIISEESKKKMLLAESELNSNLIDSFDLIYSYSEEPDQTVNQIGISLPLPIFNSKSEESRIAKLTAMKMDLLENNQKQQLSMEYERLVKERKLLDDLKVENENVLKLQMESLKMLIEKLKISQISIIDIQNSKMKLIQTMTDLINVETVLNQNAISINYITGEYND